VDDHGLPQNVHLVRGLGMGLDENAVAAVKQYRFAPTMKNGTPITTGPMTIVVKFAIQ
jgi:protein TonB